MFWFPNYFQHILVWASACKVLQHSMPCDTRNLVKHVGIILCMLTISNVYVYIYIYIYMYICMYVCVLHHLRKQLAASNAGTPASTVSQQRWHDSRTYTKDTKPTAGSKHTVPHIFSPILFKWFQS